MNTPARLGLYGAGLLAVFGVAFAAGGVLVPDATVAAWQHSAAYGATHTPDPSASTTQEADVNGTSIAQAGFTLSEIQAPLTVGEEGTLSFAIVDRDGTAVTEYERAHGKDLHLIVVRSDGAGYRHVHPILDATTGTWSLPWTWERAGTYRVYADFTSGGTSVTLSRFVTAGGELTPEPRTSVVTDTRVDGIDVSVSGELVAGAASDLTIDITRNGAPVTELEPYLGAFGHLVALRDGDLAYLHVHAHGEEPAPGETSGPTVSFTAQAPTAGRYLLYLDFQVAGTVHTAELVMDAVAGTTDTSTDAGHGGH
ncbi:heavy-metal-associated domain-containing protein [Microbacterium nymphoidis]|uniref:heavy-metal-associated domain-containing protein n=1 Tax=Microbacterium nymphoidis TaxID=2898586 RepID=UPI001E28FF1A|nr:heavy-metal-associated domain-containing protein [Microbacterium nymphoidis]MCD2498166.1 heavy-metal-associated domain-containing protein [Microbacterium nymphoidis]